MCVVCVYLLSVVVRRLFVGGGSLEVHHSGWENIELALWLRKQKKSTHTQSVRESSAPRSLPLVNEENHRQFQFDNRPIIPRNEHCFAAQSKYSPSCHRCVFGFFVHRLIAPRDVSCVEIVGGQTVAWLHHPRKRELSPTSPIYIYYVRMQMSVNRRQICSICYYWLVKDEFFRGIFREIVAAFIMWIYCDIFVRQKLLRCLVYLNSARASSMDVGKLDGSLALVNWRFCEWLGEWQRMVSVEHCKHFVRLILRITRHFQSIVDEYTFYQSTMSSGNFVEILRRRAIKWLINTARCRAICNKNNALQACLLDWATK